jgi:hypothetical protein
MAPPAGQGSGPGPGPWPRWSSYFLLTSRHPQPQLLLADGKGVLGFLLSRLAISLTSFRSGFSSSAVA